MPKGHTNNPNGRPKGKPNRTTRELRGWVHSLLNRNTYNFEKDLRSVEPVQRLAIMEKMLKYCLPLHSVINLREQVNEEYAALEKLLNSAPDEAVQAIAAKVFELQQMNRVAEETEQTQPEHDNA